mgnify:CR=1 FL=1
MKVSEYFGENVFSRAVMQERLPKKVYAEVMSVVEHGGQISMASADVVAKAMMEWAIEKGATHYTHWFQPLTGVTAEKHDSFLSAPDENGKEILNLTGKQLIMGEPDASSFPSGGLRSTHYARGYTAWDMTSPAFVKEMACGTILCIPTVFVAYSGEALDNKTPLLRSMQALSQQAVRIVHLFGNTQAERVIPSVGAEQEYFIVDREKYLKRRDLIYTGRTLFGAPAPKGQELDDQYFGVIRERVGAFMKDLNKELWKMGITATTQHNEVAPAQHECAPIYCTCNVAVDQNQLMMETMKRVATQHGLVCLLHEKPFAGVNGSGKHNNWSITSDLGENLLDPGKTPNDNLQFLLVLSCIIKAVDRHADLLRMSTACVGNDHRLGANEAPPAVVSMFLGTELTEILDAIESDTAYDAKEKELLKIGVHVLPKFPKDTTDRNRTSPFAFTGNKFEFRMLGSAASISDANVVLNTAVAESLRQYADKLEGAEDFETALHDLIRDTIRAHKRIIFNGNGYDASWLEEAEKRGLLNLKTTPACAPYLMKEKNVRLFVTHKVYSETELHARYEILLENYSKVLRIEALTMLDMVQTDILPAVSDYTAKLVRTAAEKKSLLGDTAGSYECRTAARLSALTETASEDAAKLSDALMQAGELPSAQEAADFYQAEVFKDMAELRLAVDEMETLTARACWPYPTYGELLFSVR